MRTFIILRGPQASGRTRFICESGMSPWHVDQRAIEALTCEPVIDRNGAMVFDRKSRGRARERVLDALREKFMRGSLVLFEPTDTGSPVGRATVAASDRTILAAIEEARAWRYRVLIVDFTEGLCPQEIEALQLQRPDPFHLGVHGNIGRNLAHMRRRVGLEDVDASWTTPSEIAAAGGLLALIEPASIDINHFDNVVAIGDIHGCHRTLTALIGPDGPRSDVAYIFTGDYINKGPRSAQVLTYLLDQFEGRDNAFFLHGNHEKALEDWVAGRPVRKKAFSTTTLPDFEARRFAKRDARRFLSMLSDALRFEWNGLTILASHGGFARVPRYLSLLSGEHLAYGTEDALFDVDAAWEAGVLAGDIPGSNKLIQVHGHRNNHALPVTAGAGSFNLEGGVEAGGAMRAVILQKRDEGETRISTLEVPNCEARSGREEQRASRAEELAPFEAHRDTSIQEIV